MARLVNKQFNSPIGLYSPRNIQDVLDRESQILANGAVGIDFRNPEVGKPDNLKNSAVLRMLEEEESRQRNGYGPGVKRVAWPPPHEIGQDYIENSAQSQGGPHYPSQPASYQQNNQPQSVPSNAPYQQQQRAPLKLDVSQTGSSPLASPLSSTSQHSFRPPTPSKGWAPVHSPVATPSQPSWRPNTPLQPAAAPTNQPAWRQNSPAKFQAAHQPVNQQTFLGQQYAGAQQSYAPVQNQPSQQYQTPQQYQSPGQQYQTPGQQYQSPGQQYQTPGQQYQTPAQQYQIPVQQYQPPGQQYQTPAQQYQTPAQQYQSPIQQYQSPEQQYKTASQEYSYSQQYQSSEQYQSQPQYQSQVSHNQVPQSPQRQGVPFQVQRQASRPVEPPPTTITLRSQAPVSQASPPVFTSQPATANLKGGKNLRGDLKWPPEEVKQQAEEENRLRVELARGPVCRPRKVRKDYTSFFEQHALNSMYPGYKIPPGTQFYRAD